MMKLNVCLLGIGEEKKGKNVLEKYPHLKISIHSQTLFFSSSPMSTAISSPRRGLLSCYPGNGLADTVKGP